MKRMKLLFATCCLCCYLTVWLAGAPASSADVVDAAPGSATQHWAQKSTTLLSGTDRQQLALRTVQIVMLQDTQDGLMIIGVGSGTLISADGLVLTNAPCRQSDYGRWFASR